MAIQTPTATNYGSQALMQSAALINRLTEMKQRERMQQQQMAFSALQQLGGMAGDYWMQQVRGAQQMEMAKLGINADRDMQQERFRLQTKQQDDTWARTQGPWTDYESFKADPNNWDKVQDWERKKEEQGLEARRQDSIKRAEYAAQSGDPVYRKHEADAQVAEFERDALYRRAGGQLSDFDRENMVKQIGVELASNMYLPEDVQRIKPIMQRIKNAQTTGVLRDDVANRDEKRGKIRELQDELFDAARVSTRMPQQDPVQQHMATARQYRAQAIQEDPNAEVDTGIDANGRPFYSTKRKPQTQAIPNPSYHPMISKDGIPLSVKEVAPDIVQKRRNEISAILKGRKIYDENLKKELSVPVDPREVDRLTKMSIEAESGYTEYVTRQQQQAQQEQTKTLLDKASDVVIQMRMEGSSEEQISNRLHYGLGIPPMFHRDVMNLATQKAVPPPGFEQSVAAGVAQARAAAAIKMPSEQEQQSPVQAEINAIMERWPDPKVMPKEQTDRLEQLLSQLKAQ